MKKVMMVATATALLIASFVTAQAQKKASRFYYGPTIGLNVSNLKFSESPYDISSKTGLVIGGFAGFNVTDDLSVQIETLYSQQGAKQTTGFGAGNGKYYVNNINIPLLAKYKVWRGAYAFGGPQVALITSAKTDVNGKMKDIDNELKGTDFSAVFGAGYQMENGLSGQIRYNLGLTDISDNSKTIKTTSLQLTIGYDISRLL